ncbi:MAG: ASKHA domain-containing protein [Methanoregulaceae archaeon]|jgi:uncharacterized 2Fe-2S/4Fe-4S cluster protein (DUF4445 family)
MDQGSIRVIFHPMNKVATVPKGTPLLDALRDTGIPIESICGGKGLCRKCRVILTKGECSSLPQIGGSKLSPEEQSQGYYFACQVRVIANCEFTIPVESRIDSPQILLSSEMHIETLSPSVMHYQLEITPSNDAPSANRSIRLLGYSGSRPKISDQMYESILTSDKPLIATISTVKPDPEIIKVEPEEQARQRYGIAIDLGTTTVVGCLVDLTTGEIIETGSTLNRQITYGEELITRIGYSATPEGLKKMQRAAVESIDTVIGQLTSASGIKKTDIIDVTVGGNTVMNHLLCGFNPTYLEMANAVVPRHPIIKKASEIELAVNPDACVYCIPNVSRFLGGDAVGDVIASGMHISEDMSLLIDLGTNGEIIIGSKDWLASVSCASGPAFEGGGITFGMRAMRGAIEHVRIDPITSEVTYTVIGKVPPRGICGSAIIDAAAGMVAAGILDFAGKLVESHPSVHQGAEGPEYVLIPAHKTGVGRDIVITQRDIDYLMDTKAATCGAISVLLKKYKLSTADIRHIFFAGAFGAFTDISNAVRFGIIPDFPNARSHPIGNGSLSGAYATLVSQEFRKQAQEVAHRMVYIDLLVDTDFIEEYSAALYIPGKPELFSSYHQTKV